MLDGAMITRSLWLTRKQGALSWCGVAEKHSACRPSHASALPCNQQTNCAGA